MVQQMMPMDVEGTAQTVASNRRQFKHIGKLKDDGANVAIISEQCQTRLNFV